MTNKTAIEWTQETWNPTVGCDRISPGCANCYAKTLHDKRHKAFTAGKELPVQYAKPFEQLQMIESRLDDPLRRKKPTTYFVNSVSDLFHEDVPDAFIDRVFAVMALAGRHTFQVLTKRADRMRDYFSEPVLRRNSILVHALKIAGDVDGRPQGGLLQIAFLIDELWAKGYDWPVPNVWLGVSVENQHFADERIPLLLQTPAAIRFISAEPLLGPIDLYAGSEQFIGACEECSDADSSCDVCSGMRGLDWVIVGGESGAGARPFDIAWGRSLVEQCKEAGVPVFVKQLGARVRVSGDAQEALGAMLGKHRMERMPGCDGDWRVVLRSAKGGDPAEWPEDLRVREMPAPRHA